MEVFQLQSGSVSNLGVIQHYLNSLFRMQRNRSEFEKWVSNLKHDTVLFYLFKMVASWNVYTHNLLHEMHLIFFIATMHLHFSKISLIFFSIYIFQIFVKFASWEGKAALFLSLSFPSPTPSVQLEVSRVALNCSREISALHMRPVFILRRAWPFCTRLPC